jgi:hypothetical protein
LSKEEDFLKKKKKSIKKKQPKNQGSSIRSTRTARGDPPLVGLADAVGHAEPLDQHRVNGHAGLRKFLGDGLWAVAQKKKKKKTLVRTCREPRIYAKKKKKKKKKKLIFKNSRTDAAEDLREFADVLDEIFGAAVRQKRRKVRGAAVRDKQARVRMVCEEERVHDADIQRHIERQDCGGMNKIKKAAGQIKKNKKKTTAATIQTTTIDFQFPTAYVSKSVSCEIQEEKKNTPPNSSRTSEQGGSLQFL